MPSIALIDTVYPEFVKWLYTNKPELEHAPYEDQLAAALKTCYHNVSVWANPLREHGFTVHEIWANHVPLAAQWCREHNRPDLFPGGADTGTLAEKMARVQPVKHWFVPVVIEQIKAMRPDILWCSNLYTFDDAFLEAVEGHYTFAVGQNAAMQPTNSLKRLNLTVSASMVNVEYFRSLGLPSELLPHGFNSRILQDLEEDQPPPEHDFVFTGNMYPAHQNRADILKQVASRVPIEVWTDAKLGDAYKDAKVTRRPAVWGMDMYRVLARSRIVLNSHLDSTGDWATNQRLFEVTGVGSLLLTDQKRNMPDLFEPDREAVTYSSVEELVEKVAYYLEHEEERREIAEAGRRRTLTDHTTRQRGRRIAEILARHY